MTNAGHRVQRFIEATQRSWRQLSATQRHMIQGFGVLTTVLLLATALGSWAPQVVASYDGSGYTGTAVRSQFSRLRLSLDTTAGELELARIELRRAEAVIRYSSQYQITGDLAELIYDVAVREGIEPELAFRLIRLESGFNVRARSRVGDHGLAQVRIPTARFYDPDITEEDLYNPQTNLTIGFRYLRHLLETYQDLRLALLAYNRGPTRLRQLLDEGRDPRNGYASRIIEGFPILQEPER
jgi:soluble lytic murein transglycosylase-like protein